MVTAAGSLLDATHDPRLRSWVESANEPGCDFPIQNLPFVRFRRRSSFGLPDSQFGDLEDPDPEAFRGGVGIGDQILDLSKAAHHAPWGEGVVELIEPMAAGDFAAFMQLGRPAWRAVRAALSAALAADSIQGPFLELCLVPQAKAEYAMPCRIGDYTDFFTGIHHARAAGSLFRPDNPLMPNYQYVPIGYHGRASSVILEGGGVKRPMGQIKADAAVPLFGPSRRLDYELELGLWVGQANELGRPVAIEQAEDRLFGITPLNDWSARDIQAWEYQPLGPFLAKSFATSISPWVVTFDALAPFRRPFVRPAGDPAPLPYLDSPFNREHGAVEMTLEVWLQTAKMRAAGDEGLRLSQSNMLDAYWTPAQLVTHHASNGCNLNIGDLLGTGTLSGPSREQGGCLLELSRGGREQVRLANGEVRSFLEDGDRVTLKAYCEAPGAVRIGLGSVSGTVLPAG